MKIGVYLCQCGGNISNTIDLEAVENALSDMEDIVLLKQHKNMCSGTGQKLIIEDVKASGLDRVVVAACSPQFHEKTFMKTMNRAGLNPYMLEISNLREHVSWALKDKPEIATEKAIDMVHAAVAKIRGNVPLDEKTMELGNKVLVVGAGIAGIQNALDLSAAGMEVTLVEKEPTIGGNMAILTKTFPTEDCAACILSPKMAAVEEDENITLHVDSEVTNISGHRLHFEATIEKKPRYIKPTIDMDMCLGCEECVEICPVSGYSKWEQGVIPRKAIYIPAPHAIPYKYVIEPDDCLEIKEKGSCGKCLYACPQDAMDFSQEPEVIKDSFDSVVVATGYDIYDASEKTVFGYGRYENVVNALEMERIVDHITEAEPPRDPGKRVAFIQCIGSRDEQIGREYCSRVCCMYSTKLASLLKQAKPETDIYIFYTDLRAFGKGFEEYYKRAQEMGIKFVRGKPAYFTEDPVTKEVTVVVEDTLSRQIIESEFDTVVLANGLGLSKGTEKVAKSLKLAKSDDGFLKEAHPKYRPVDTLVEGVFLAGTVQGPKDIPDTVAQASAAAARVIGTLNQDEVKLDPTLAYVDKDKCNACGECFDICPKNAIQKGENGMAYIVEAMCVGCGACIASCPLEAIDLAGNNNRQLYNAVEASLERKKEGEKRTILFADDSCTYRLADTVGIRKMKYYPNIRIHRIPSGARIQPKLIEFAFAKGADAVIIGDCSKEDSRFEWANDFTAENIAKVRKKLEEAGIDNPNDRVFLQIFDSADMHGFVKVMNDFGEKIEAMDNIPKKAIKKISEN